MAPTMEEITPYERAVEMTRRYIYDRLSSTVAKGQARVEISATPPVEMQAIYRTGVANEGLQRASEDFSNEGISVSIEPTTLGWTVQLKTQ